MSRVILGSYLIRYPLGGMMSWVLQYIVGFQRLGHEIFFVEKSGYPDSCFDPARGVMSDDCSYGTRAANRLLGEFGLADCWCYVDATGNYHGMSADRVRQVFRTSDVFIDMGTHGSWLEEARQGGCTVLLDGEPGFTQMKMALAEVRGKRLPVYDHYFTTGRNVGRSSCAAPTAGRNWRPIFHPVVVDLFDCGSPPPDAPFTTVMNWQSYDALEYEGTSYGHKDREFSGFETLPALTKQPLELAVAGKDVPRERLRAAGWRVSSGHGATETFDSFRSYLSGSRAEFGVCKNGFVSTNSGWFSDRSAAYLASGRPVVLQETGFSAHLPCGEGLFAVSTIDEAAAAIEQIAADPVRHQRRAREIAREYLDAGKVLAEFLRGIGI